MNFRHIYITPCVWFRVGGDFIELNIAWGIWLWDFEWDRVHKP